MRKSFAGLLIALSPLCSLAATSKAVLDVQNLTCRLCVVTVQRALQQVPGVQEAQVDFDGKTATVTFDAKRATADTLTKATSDAGFPSKVRKQ